jgi:hypothetical protein
VPQGNLKTMNNRSSVTYNILNNDHNQTSGVMVLKIFDKNITNKKKGVAEICDLTRAFNPNFNKKYQGTLDDKPNVFHRYNGIFSHMYDAAHRNGNIVIPFRNNNENKPKEVKRITRSKSPTTKTDKR